MNNNSEVARLRQQIDLEVEALDRLAHGVATVASHRIIALRYKSLVERCKLLGQHVGEREAFRWVVERMNERDH